MKQPVWYTSKIAVCTAEIYEVGMVGSVFGRWLLLVMAIVVGLFGLIVAGGYWRLSSSLPRLTGEVKAPVTAAVSVHRDADGVPTIVAQTEPDMAFALGFLHAQERYFQMDLLRRAGTGELAALLGSSVVAIDRSRRRHRFRWRAQQAIERLSAPERAVIFAYTAGVRAGLADLSAPPFEYDLLGVTPEPWQEEDAYCVSLAMFFTLQDASGANELRRAAIERALSPRLAELALSPGTKWDAAIDNSLLSLPSWSNTSGVPVQEAAPPSAKPAPDAPPPPGSNNWAVSGRFSTHGGAMVADDMHLRLRMPNIWFRARYRIEDDEPFDSTGVTLPGTPLIIAGSNGHIAWGFTNAFIDTSDLVVIERGSSPETYRTPDGEAKIERFEEKIEIRGEPAQTLVVKETIWGPIVGRDFDGRQVALRWTAHDLRGNNLGLRKLGRARTLEEAIAAAQAAGMPNQNVALAAKDGRIAWTISGLVPARPPGCDGARPTSWADGRCAWRGYAPPSEVPKVVETDQGRLWSANNRIVGPELRGAARYRNPVMGARARQIRDGLFAKDRLSERDLLAIQLDDRATFLAPWRGLMLDALTESSQAAMRQAVEDWSGRADVESVGYRVVKAFRTAMLARIVDPLLAPARRLTEEAEGVNVAWARPRNIEHMLWTLLEARPEGLWPNGEESWAAAIDAAVADVQDKVAQAGGLDQFTWGSANRSAIRHPLSGAVPLLGQWLDLPSIPLPGDTDMPRVQRPDFGASERFVVSPGREAKGIFHMPGGQASHPLSSYLHAGHEAWATGAPTPFLPGDKAWTFTLVPATRDSPRK